MGNIIIFIGLFFFAVGTIGLIRLPDFYSRMHATGKCDTLGAGLVILGVGMYDGFSTNAIKLFLMVTFIFVANPTATHVLAKAAYDSGLIVWMKGKNNDSA